MIVLALVMGLVFGGLRVADAAGSAAQFGRVTQLANLGRQVTDLVQALENERDETTGIISGGNVDNGLLASLLRRHETAVGRRVRLYTRVPDRPGGLAELLQLVANTRANLLTLEHLREAAADALEYLEDFDDLSPETYLEHYRRSFGVE